MERSSRSAGAVCRAGVCRAGVCRTPARRTACSFTAALWLALCVPAAAQASSLATWTAAGDVLVHNAQSATLTTAAMDSGETPLSLFSALLYFDLEPALALAAGSLPADTFEGSGLQQAFTAAAGSTYSFDWRLSTQDFDAAQTDRAFVLIDGSTLALLGPVAATPAAGRFSHTFSTAGAHALAIVVMDVNAADRVSTLEVSGFTVNAVPEPGTLALVLAAALGLVVRRKPARRAMIG